MKRALTMLFGVLLVLAAVLGLAFVGLALTESGTRLLAGQAERLLPLRLDGLSGTLWRDLSVEQLTVDLDDQELIVERLQVAQSLFPLLFDNRLELHSVHAERVELVRRRAPDPQASPARLQLPLMPIDIGLDQLRIDQLQLPGAPAVAVQGSATWSDAALNISSLVVESEQIRLSLSGGMTGTSRPTLDATIEWTLPAAGWSGQGRFTGPADALEVTHVIEGPYRLDIAGTADATVPADPVLDLMVEMRDVQAEGWALSAIVARIAGKRGALVVDASAQVDLRRGEPFPLRVALRGPAVGPVAVEAHAEPLGGSVRATASVDWSEGVQVRAEGTARDLSLAPVLDGRSGELGADFAVEYGSAGLAVALTDLAGTVDGRRVAGSGRVRGVDDAWVFESAELAAGDNRATFSGRWQAGALAADGRIEAPALDQLGLGLAGALSADVDLAGTWPELDGRVALRAPALSAGGSSVQGLEASATLDGGRILGALTAARLGSAGVEVVAPELSLTGGLDELDWRLDWTGGQSRGRIGRRDQVLWLAVDAMRVQVAQTTVAIENPVRLQVTDSRIEATPVCIVGGEARACVARFGVQDGRIDTAGELERLPLALAQPWLPVAVHAGSYLAGRWDLRGAGAEWSGAISLAGRELAVELPGEEQERVALPDVELTGTLADGGVEAELLAAGEGLRVSGEARLAPLTADGRLSGSLEVSLPALAEFDWLRELDPRVAELDGALSASLVLSGAARAPVLQGSLAFRDGVVGLQDPEIRLEALALDARMDTDGTLEFEGKGIQANGRQKGTVELTGRASGILAGEPELEASLRGDNLSARHPQFEAVASPDLTLTLREGITRVTGQVELPRADVRLNTLPASVPRPSPDVVVVGREEPSGSGVPNQLRFNVRVRVGPEVSLSALGVEAKLAGELRVQRDARGQTTVRGTLDVAGGLIAAQGQTLSIESGKVIYNGPVANPYLDVRAVRQIENQQPPVKVGLHITGNANRLTSTVFSEPAMAENRALGFLVLGRDIEQSQSDADSDQMLTAAINLGLSQSKSLIGELQRATGLDELSAVAQGQDGFAVAAGERISEDIFLRYTYNTLTAVGTFLVSFDLSERWRLEAVTGEEAAMDILYRIDR